MKQPNADPACCAHDHGAPDHQRRHASHDGHNHTHVHDSSGSSLLITLGLNLLIPVVQVVGGLQAHSMALLSDAAHNFSDFTAVLIAFIANRIARRGVSASNTFGYRRAEILAAAINVTLLVGAAVFIVIEAAHRLHHPEAVSGRLVILVAGVGVLGNGLSALLLHRDAGHNLNVRGAFLHMLGDLLTSVVVLLNGIVLLFKPWYWLDPALSVVIALFILKNCWTLLRAASTILMNATPAGLELSQVKSSLEQIPGISGVHYLHAWNVCSSSVAFSCHVVVPDQRLSKLDALSEKIRHRLLHRFGIDHPVLQFETAPCGEGGMLCELLPGSADNGSHGSPESLRRESRGGFLKKPFHFWIRLILGVVFIIASVDKIYQPAAFARAVYNYQLLPDGLINLVAIILPWLELSLGLLLVVGFWLPTTVTLSTALLLVFYGALLFNVARGLDVHCGCFSTSTEGTPATTWYLIRDGAFLLMAGALFFKEVIRRKLAVAGKSDPSI